MMQSKISLQELHSFAIEIAKEGGAVLRDFWGKRIVIEEKAYTGDLVTEADKASEHVILEMIRQKYPHHEILSEEAGMHEGEGADYLWLIDPLDGTTNYTHHFPMVSVSIGLLHKGKPIVGVVYNPIYDELFEAAEGMGARLNGHEIQVSRTKDLKASLLATGFSYDRRENPETNYQQFCHLTHLTHGVRRGGSAALDLAFVAAGRLDGFWERGLNPWDLAAGVVLIREAGGQVSAYDQTDFDLFSGRILATNGKIHESLSLELN